MIKGMRGSRRSRSPPSPLLPHPGMDLAPSQSQMNSRGNILNEQQMGDKYKKAGMCDRCSIVQTHKKILAGLKRVPMTIDCKVYKGYCLTCYSMTDAKLRLIEAVDRDSDLWNRCLISDSAHSPINPTYREGHYKQDRPILASVTDNNDGTRISTDDDPLDALAVLCQNHIALHPQEYVLSVPGGAPSVTHHAPPRANLGLGGDCYRQPYHHFGIPQEVDADDMTVMSEISTDSRFLPTNHRRIDHKTSLSNIVEEGSNDVSRSKENNQDKNNTSSSSYPHSHSNNNTSSLADQCSHGRTSSIGSGNQSRGASHPVKSGETSACESLPARKHKEMAQDGNVLTSTSLDTHFSELRKCNAKRKFKAAVRAVISANKSLPNSPGGNYQGGNAAAQGAGRRLP